MELNQNEYSIERWDVVYDEKTNTKKPILYILPDDLLIEFSKINENSLYVTIKETNIDGYNDIRLKAKLVPSSLYPVNRPNFFEKTKYYVIVLEDKIWLGYPRKDGKVLFEGENKVELKNNEEVQISPTPTSESTSSPTSSPTSSSLLNNEKTSILEGFNDYIKSSSNLNSFLMFLVFLLFLLLIIRCVLNIKK